VVSGHDFKVLQRSTIAPDYFKSRFGAPWLLFHRVDLHNELKRMATEPRPNTAAVAKINLLSEIVDLDLDGNITLANGKQLKKDLVVVADGIRVCLTVLIILRLYPLINIVLVALKRQSLQSRLLERTCRFESRPQAQRCTDS